jgi:hypothetical protein
MPKNDTPNAKPSDEEVVVETPAEEVAEVVEETSAPAEDYTEEVVPEPVAEPIPAKKKNDVPPTEYAVFGEGEVDDVFASRVIYKNVHAQRSLSVYHVQRRLREWGFPIDDQEGFYGDSTFKATQDFQTLRGLEATGFANYDTLSSLFEGDTNVRVLP